MIVNDLMTKIQTNLSGFSKGQRLIARYIAEHYDKAAFMTASRLGATVGVSESTVVRFATELGYDGYPHLQKALQEMIRNLSLIHICLVAAAGPVSNFLLGFVAYIVALVINIKRCV